jgi:hypothetical protein
VAKVLNIRSHPPWCSKRRNAQANVSYFISLSIFHIIMGDMNGREGNHNAGLTDAQMQS